ncbi:hypothetical protein HYH02_007453 [Chlamydomonas schloesseri]|uniref:BTB domain-containing protein n=1 Tax=Chlamydomonas schloesseri TaxID=2026947 RepID=A0A835WHV7_9CHLO|nr:hypothetical protein HYH02_007453 [Chlamydomonas schloesseri]|eukprot:KAG2447529.1 hypothetical protein HYH02_007453 [Chlamydomonas schloesseri]
MPVLANSPSYASLGRAGDGGEQMPPTSLGRVIVRAKQYGGRFSNGFLDFFKTSELADCTVVGPNGQEYRLHSLLLAYHSEFFRRALSSDFAEGAARRIVLRFEDSGDTWPLLVNYFYTEEITLTDANVLALFAASRELLIPAIQDFCADFAQNSLEPSNALSFLRQAVQYNCDAFRTSCVSLVASSFNTCCAKSTDGLPVDVILEILDHPQLFVQTEEQVLLFVQNYVRRHRLDEATVRQLYRGVRLPFLSNDRLAALAAEPPGHGPPMDMLMAAMAQRLQLLDHPERLQQQQQQASAIAATASAAAAAAAGACGGAVASTSHQHTLVAGPLAAVVAASGDGRASRLPSGSSTAGGTAAVGGAAAAAGSDDTSGALTVADGSSNSNSGTGGQVSSGSGAGGGGGGGGGARLLALLNNMAGGCGPPVPRKTYACSLEYSLPGGSEYICIPMELVWEELASNLTVRVSGDTVEGDADSILRVTPGGGSSSDTDTGPGSWFTVSSEDASRPVWVEVGFPACMRVVELSKYTFSHGMNMIAHMFPYGISDSSWFQMKGMSTHVSPGDDEPFTPLRTADNSCQQHTEYCVTVDPAHSKQVVWRRLRILAGDENAQQQVRLSIRKLKLYGRVEVSLLRDSPGRDVVAAWRRRKEAAAAAAAPRAAAHFGQLLGGPSFKRNLTNEHF